MDATLQMKTGGVVAAYTHVALAVSIPVLQQAPGLGVYDSLKESVEEDRMKSGSSLFSASASRISQSLV
jgi:hypothetical protein